MNQAPKPPDSDRLPIGHELRIALIYAACGAGWIIATDLLLDALSLDARLQTFKGWLYVALTAVGFYVFLRNGARRLYRWQAALKASQEAYTAFITASPDLMFELAPDGTFLGYRQSTRMGLNMPPEQFIGRRVQDVLPQIGAQVEDALARAFATGEVQIFYYQLPLDGEPRDYEARIVARNADSAVAIVRDITDRRRAEEALQRANRAYRLLSDCNQIMVRASDEITLLKDICQIVVSSGHFPLAWVGYARDDAARTLEPVASFGAESGYLQLLQTTWANEPRGRGPAGRALRSGQSVVTDCATDPDFEPWRSAALERGYRSVLALPLTDGAQVFGVLAVYADEPGAFRHREEVELLAELASDLAYGVIALRTRAERERARQAEREQRLLAEALSDTAMAVNSSLDLDQVLDRILENIRRVVPHDTASITLVDGDNFRVARHVGFDAFGVAEGISDLRFELGAHEKYRQWVRETHQPLIIADTARSDLWETREGTEWIRSSIWAPIFDGEELAGVISLDSQQAGFFTPDHAARLGAFAAHAATAIRNAQLFASERQQRTLAEALSDTAATTIGTRDPQAVMERILANLKRVVPHDVANIMLIEGHRARVVRESEPASQTGIGWLDRLTFDVRHNPILQRVIETRQAQIVSDPDAEPDWQPHPETDWLHAYACAPVAREGQVIGFLNVYSRQRDFFTGAHLQHLQAFADQAALALYNAQLFTAERDQRALAEALQDTATIINSTLDLDVVTDRILDNLKRVLPHDSASLMLIEDGVGRVVRHRGFVERGLGQWLSDLRMPIDKTPTLKSMFDTHQPIVIANTATDPDWVPYPQIGWIRSYAGAPIHREGQVIGYLQVESAWPNFFTVEHARRLQSFAEQAAIALQNAQLYHDAQQHAAALQSQAQRLALINRVSTHIAHHLELEAIYRAVLLELQDALGASFGGLILFEDEKTGRLALGTHPDDQTNQGLTIGLEGNRSIDHVRATHKPLVSEDVLNDPFFELAWPALRQRGTRTLLIMPLIVGDDVIGTLGLDWVEPRQFTPDELELVETIANQASVAITKAQLYVAEREQRTLAEALRAAASAISSTLHLDTVLDRILANVGQVLPHDAANVMLIEDGIARVARGYGYAEHDAGKWIGRLRFAVNEIPIWQDMLATRRPFAVPDTQADPRWLRFPEEEWIRSTVKAPIVLEGQVIGILHLDSAQPGFFDEADAERLQAFADQAAIAIRNAQLYDAIQHHASELERRVTERTAEVEAQRGQLQAILDSMGEAVIFTRGRQVTYVNAAFTALFGYDAAALGSPSFAVPDTLLAPDHDAAGLKRAVQQSLLHSGSWRGEIEARRRDGSTFDSALTITLVPGLASADGIAYVAILRDISQDKALQAQKDRFIAHASHELRTPLANVKTRLYLLRKQPEKLDSHLEVLNRVTDNMTELIENLLDVSRFERGVIPLYQRPVDLHELVEEVIAIQRPEAERKEILLSALLPDSPLMIEADPQRIMQVITNLVINAINYTPDGGKVTIELDPLEPCDEAPQGQVAIRVRDTGIGIPSEMLSQVFEPFIRANEDVATGTGLGLTIAREIVHLHRGTIAVDSAPGEGAVFTVTLNLIGAHTQSESAISE